MKLGVKVVGDLAGQLRAEIRAGERAVTLATRQAGNELKADWRGQVVAGGLGRRLSNAIRSEVYPKGRDSLEAAALVYVQRSAVDILEGHATGATIRSKDGFWLAIPTEAAGRAPRGARITPGDWERRTGRRLRFVYRSARTALLVADDVRLTKQGRAAVAGARARKGLATVPIFTLVPFVRLRQRIDFDRWLKANGAEDLAGRVIRNWPDKDTGPSA